MCAKPARSETHGQGTRRFSRDGGERSVMVRVKNVLMMTFPDDVVLLQIVERVRSGVN